MDIHKAVAADVLKHLHQGAFGRIGERLDGKLQSALDRNLQDTLNKNEILSIRTCDALENLVCSPREFECMLLQSHVHSSTCTCKLCGANSLTSQV